MKPAAIGRSPEWTGLMRCRMKFQVEYVPVMRGSRRRAGKSDKKVIDTDTMRDYARVPKYEDDYQARVVERVFEEVNQTVTEVVKVYDVRKLEERDQSPLTEEERVIFERAAGFIYDAIGHDMGWTMTEPSLASFVSILSERMMSEESGLTDRLRQRWMSITQRERTALLAKVL